MYSPSVLRAATVLPILAILAACFTAGVGCTSKPVRQGPTATVIPSGSRADAGSNPGSKDGPDSGPMPGSAEGCLPDSEERREAGKECSCDSDCTTNACMNLVCCSGAACGAKRPAGATCTQPTDCESGFCTEGVCCNVACTGACVSCTQPDWIGECVPVPPGTKDPQDLCRVGRARYLRSKRHLQRAGWLRQIRPGHRLQAGTCEGRDKFIPSGACDGEGTCVPGVAISCAPSTCADGACVHHLFPGRPVPEPGGLRRRQLRQAGCGPGLQRQRPVPVQLLRRGRLLRERLHRRLSDLRPADRPGQVHERARQRQRPEGDVQGRGRRLVRQRRPL